MAMSPSVRRYLNQNGVTYDEVPHARSMQAAEAAHAAHIPGRQVAKAVLLFAADDPLLAVAPASRRIDLASLQVRLDCDVKLAAERDVQTLFDDCELGAVPPFGAAFGVETIVDDELLRSDDVYFEGGDHRTLVHLNAADWRRLMRDADHCAFTI